MNTQQYYAAIREKQEALTKQFPKGYCLVVSVLNREKNSTAGTFCEVLVPEAARLITDGTHRTVTDEESSAYYGAQDLQRVRNSQDNLERTRVQFDQIMGKSTK